MSSRDLNSVSIIGRLTRDSEYRVSNSGTPVLNFSIAVNRRRKSGEDWVDEVNFFDVVFMGKAAERINQFLVKGRQVAIVGELHQRKWQNSDGEKRSSVEIWAQEIQLLAQSAASSGGMQTGQYNGGNYAYPQNNTAYPPTGYADRAPVNNTQYGSQKNVAPSKEPQSQNYPSPDAFEDDDFPF